MSEVVVAVRCSAKRPYENFQKYAKCYNTCATESLFNNVASLHAIRFATLFKGDPSTGFFTSEFCESFQNTFFIVQLQFVHIAGIQLVFIIKKLFLWYFTSILCRNEK